MHTKRIKVSEAVDLFIVRCSANGCSESTIAWYRRRLGELVRFLNDPCLPAITLEHLVSFVSSKREQRQKWVRNRFHKAVSGSLSVQTLDGYVRIIRTFFGWLFEIGYLRVNPALHLKRPRLPRCLPKDVKPDDIARLLDGAKRYGEWTERNYAMILFLADTGCRVGGLVGLCMKDLDLKRRIAMVVEKGTKVRPLFFGLHTKRALVAWLKVRPVIAGVDNVFVGRNSAMSTQSVGLILKRLKEFCLIRGRVNPHAFRHSFAKRFLLNGGNLAALADLMGHSDITVTRQNYSVFLIDELKQSHARSNVLRGIVARK